MLNGITFCFILLPVITAEGCFLWVGMARQSHPMAAWETQLWICCPACRQRQQVRISVFNSCHPKRASQWFINTFLFVCAK